MEVLMNRLKELTELNGTSGAEDAVRNYILAHIPKDLSPVVDPLGNVLVYKKGRKDKGHIMVSAHMDEVALMVSDITDEGYLKFKTVGGIDSKVLYSKRVTVEGHLGVIAGKAVHLQDKEERKKPASVKSLCIDIGAASKEDVPFETGVYAYFDTKFMRFGEKAVKAKALDDRVGCSILLSLMEQEYDVNITFCFLTREEIGLAGAVAASYTVAPEEALVIEGTVCSDVPGTKPHEYVTQFGGGAVVPFMDGSLIADKDMFNQLKQIAEEENIPIQHKRSVSGGTDAGAIHKSRGGVKTAVISVPCRYIHSPAGMMHIDDFSAVYRLAEAYLKRR